MFEIEFALGLKTEAPARSIESLTAEQRANREADWLSQNDPLKRAIEVHACAVASENLRLILNISANASLLSRIDIGDYFRHNFSTDSVFTLGASIYYPHQNLILNEIAQSDSVSEALFELNHNIISRLQNSKKSYVVFDTSILVISVNSPTNVWVKFKAKVYRAGEIIKDVDARIFPIADRITVYAAVIALAAGLAAAGLAAGLPPVDRPPDKPCIALVNVSQEACDSLRANVELRLAALNSPDKRIRTFALQTSLKEVGVDPGPLDGIEEEKTLAAKDAYARIKNLHQWIGHEKDLLSLLAFEASFRSLPVELPEAAKQRPF